MDIGMGQRSTNKSHNHSMGDGWGSNPDLNILGIFKRLPSQDLVIETSLHRIFKEQQIIL
jgi:hypothetical protein